MGIIAVPNPNHEGGSAVTRSFRTGRVKHADSFSVARVRPRTSKGITDLLLLTVTRLDAACPSKKTCDGRESRRIAGDDDDRNRQARKRNPAAPESLPAEQSRPESHDSPTKKPRETTRPRSRPNGPKPPPPDPDASVPPSVSIDKTRHLFSRLESRSLSELTRQIAPPTKNGHAPPPTESRKSSQSVNPSSVRAW
jgi:hypothetical protein